MNTDVGSFSWTFVVFFSPHLNFMGSGALLGMCWIAEWATYGKTVRITM